MIITTSQIKSVTKLYKQTNNILDAWFFLYTYELKEIKNDYDDYYKPNDDKDTRDLCILVSFESFFLFIF